MRPAIRNEHPHTGHKRLHVATHLMGSMLTGVMASESMMKEIQHTEDWADQLTRAALVLADKLIHHEHDRDRNQG